MTEKKLTSRKKNSLKSNLTEQFAGNFFLKASMSLNGLSKKPLCSTPSFPCLCTSMCVWSHFTQYTKTQHTNKIRTRAFMTQTTQRRHSYRHEYEHSTHNAKNTTHLAWPLIFCTLAFARSARVWYRTTLACSLLHVYPGFTSTYVYDMPPFDWSRDRRW